MSDYFTLVANVNMAQTHPGLGLEVQGETFMERRHWLRCHHQYGGPVHLGKTCVPLIKGENGIKRQLLQFHLVSVIFRVL
jgi:hypothetical protein